jgi:hypothetical protein
MSLPKEGARSPQHYFAAKPLAGFRESDRPESGFFYVHFT